MQLYSIQDCDLQKNLRVFFKAHCIMLTKLFWKPTPAVIQQRCGRPKYCEETSYTPREVLECISSWRKFTQSILERSYALVDPINIQQVNLVRGRTNISRLSSLTNTIEGKVTEDAPDLAWTASHQCNLCCAHLDHNRHFQLVLKNKDTLKIHITGRTV